MAERELPVCLVKSACEKYLAAREEKHAKKRDALVQKALKWRSYGILKYILRPTYESVEKTISSDPWGEYALIDLNGSIDAAYVQQVLSLCEVKSLSDRNPMVKLTSRESIILKGYLA